MSPCPGLAKSARPGAPGTTIHYRGFIDTNPRKLLDLLVPEHPKKIHSTGHHLADNMDETLRQIGELLLGSIPTIIFFILLYGLYTALVHKPLARVLGERYARTQGAIEKARADVRSAEARTAEYEQRLRDARIAIFKAQEARRAQAAQARAEAVAEARAKAQAQVEQARAAIEQAKLAAKNTLEREAGRLATEIIRVVLEPGLAQAGGR